jgi:nucleoid DNA-binding protein
MSEYTGKLTGAIRAHLAGLVKSSGMPDNEQSLETMARVWFEKKEMFEAQIHALDMQELQKLPADDQRGALLLTYSGSLVSLGPRGRNGRRIEYASIQLRTDVPHLAVMDAADIEGDAALDKGLAVKGGQIQSTSPLLKIAVCGEDVPPEEQEKRIREATIFLTNGFVKINRTVAGVEGLPDQFTTKSIVTYLARMNGLSQKQTRQIIDDYHTMLESGMLLGLRVPLGKIGRLFLKLRPAQKARIGINPLTKEKITLKARPEEPVPRISFSRVMKEKARQAQL